MKRPTLITYYVLVLVFSGWMLVFGTELTDAALYTLFGIVFIGFSVLEFSGHAASKVRLAGGRLTKPQAIAIILAVTATVDLLVYHPGVYVLTAQFLLLVSVVGVAMYHGDA
jgi:hypothetical protein